MDRETLAYYDANPAAYAEMVAREHPGGSPWLARLAAHLPAGGRVLDFGAGPGHDAARLRDMGFAVDAIDGSPGLAAEAMARHGVAVRVAEFADLDAVAAYDGIWAAFSLLHARRAELPGHVARLARALVPGGVLYLGMKAGEGEARDALGRHYCYVTADALAAMLAEAGLETLRTGDGEGRGMTGAVEPCLHMLARRPAVAPR